LTTSKNALIDTYFFTQVCYVFAFLNLMVTLQVTNSNGNDFPPMLFMQLLNDLAEQLPILFRVFMKLGEVPDEWKAANVTPSFKKGVSSNPLNYRPISITCVCCKLFKSGIKHHLWNFVMSSI